MYVLLVVGVLPDKEEEEEEEKEEEEEEDVNKLYETKEKDDGKEGRLQERERERERECVRERKTVT